MQVWNTFVAFAPLVVAIAASVPAFIMVRRFLRRLGIVIVLKEILSLVAAIDALFVVYNLFTSWSDLPVLAFAGLIGLVAFVLAFTVFKWLVTNRFPRIVAALLSTGGGLAAYAYGSVAVPAWFGVSALYGCSYF